MLRKVKHILINYLTSNLLKAVSEDQILQISGRNFLYNHKNLSPEEIQSLREEAKMLKESFLWKIMTKETEFLAYQVMTSKAKTIDDIIWGKAIFYSIDLMNKFLNNLL